MNARILELAQEFKEMNSRKEAHITLKQKRGYRTTLVDGRKPLGPPPKRYAKGQPTR